MARKYLMSWNRRLLAWQKMFQGARYQVYCSELGAPPNKEESYKAANEWWLQKLALLKPRLPDDYRVDVSSLKQLEYARKLGVDLPLPFVPGELIERFEEQGLKPNPAPLPEILKHANPWEALAPRKEGEPQQVIGERSRIIQRAEVRVAVARAQVEDRLRIIDKLGQSEVPKP